MKRTHLSCLGRLVLSVVGRREDAQLLTRLLPTGCTASSAIAKIASGRGRGRQVVLSDPLSDEDFLLSFQYRGLGELQGQLRSSLQRDVPCPDPIDLLWSSR